MAEAPQASSKVTVIDPNGTLGTLDASEAGDAIQNGGFRIPSSQEIEKIQDQQKYGTGTGSALAAAGLGAARALTFGGSDALISQGGGWLIPTDEAAKLKEYRPGFSTAGEVSGVVGSLLAPEIKGLGAVGELTGAISPVNALAKVGRGVSEAAAPLAEKIAGSLANPETSPIVHQIISKAIPAGLGSSVEGAAYGLGQSVSEASLGDPDLNAEKVLSNVGYGALIGGGLGSLLTAGEVAVPHALDSAKNAISKTIDTAMGGEGEVGPLGKAYAKASSFVSGKPEEQIIEALKQRELSLVEPEQRLELTSKFADSLNEQHETINKLLKSANTDLRDEETQKLLQGVDPVPAQAQWSKSISDLQETAQKMREQPSLYSDYFPAKIEKVINDVKDKIKPDSSAADIFTALDDVKGRLDSFIPYGRQIDPKIADAVNETKGIRSSIKTSLESENLWGQAGARQAAFNDAQRNYLNLVGKKGLFRKYFMTEYPTKSGSIAYRVDPGKIKSFLRSLNDVTGEDRSEVLSRYMEASHDLVNQVDSSYASLPGKTFDREGVKSVLAKNQDYSAEAMKHAEYGKMLGSLGGGAHNAPLMEGAALFAGAHNPALGAAIESWNMLKAPNLAIQRLAKIERLAQKTTNQIAKGAKAIFNFGVKTTEPVAGYLASRLDSSGAMSSYRDYSEELHKRTNDPQGTMDALSKATHESYAAAPQISGGLQQSLIRATQFLSSKLPETPPKKPLSPEFAPSKAEISKFERYRQVIEKPAIVLDQVKQGTITSESVEALQAVYPKLYQEMQANVMDELTKHLSKVKEIPYKTKLALSLFMGQDLVDSLTSSSIASNQMSMMQAGSKQAQADSQMKTKPSHSGMAKLNQSDRLLTDLQSNAQRERA